MLSFGRNADWVVQDKRISNASSLCICSAAGDLDCGLPPVALCRVGQSARSSFFALEPRYVCLTKAASPTFCMIARMCRVIAICRGSFGLRSSHALPTKEGPPKQATSRQNTAGTRLQAGYATRLEKGRSLNASGYS